MPGARCRSYLPVASLRIYFGANHASPNWKPKNNRDFGDWYRAEIPCGAEGTAEMSGVPFGFAQGRLSTVVLLRICEAQPPLRMTANFGRGRPYAN
jgi:hypothetical protein